MVISAQALGERANGGGRVGVGGRLAGLEREPLRDMARRARQAWRRRRMLDGFDAVRHGRKALWYPTQQPARTDF